MVEHSIGIELNVIGSGMRSTSVRDEPLEEDWLSAMGGEESSQRASIYRDMLFGDTPMGDQGCDAYTWFIESALNAKGGAGDRVRAHLVTASIDIGG